MRSIRFLPLAFMVLCVSAAAATYTVKPGDTLYSIARSNHLDPVELMKLNKLPSSTIQVGQSLNVGGSAPASASKPASTPVSPSKAASLPQNTPQGAGAAPQQGVVRAAAFRFLNIPYRLGGVGDGGIDCSGYTRAVFQQLGVNLPRTARAQFASGTPVSQANLQTGDLVFFNTMGNGVSHVGIYMGGGQFTNANSYYGHTMLEKFSNPYWASRFVGARRVLHSN